MTAQQLPYMPEEKTNQAKAGLGYFGGVFTPSILTILGVVMYLRFGWVVGNAGLGGALLIVVVAHLISVATGLSVASIATNRTVRAGGAYYMISRSLGAPAGAAIGIPLFLGQALSITFYVVGFTESLNMLWPALDPQLTGTIVLIALTLISLKSASAAIKVQYFIMAAIALSLVSFFMGVDIPDRPMEVTWWNEGGASFAVVFAVFFPAVTGIMAGVSMSGDLKDARRGIPKGTLLAIAVGFVIYMVIPFGLAWSMDLPSLMGKTDAMWRIATFPALIYVGVWGATLSSAVGSILGAPRTLQALARDGLAPGFLGKGSGPMDEPKIGLVFSFLLAEVGVLAGSLDVIAPILTMFFLATYGMTNLACALERWAATPSFRPSFEAPIWVSLVGAVGSFYVMSILNLPAMLAAMAFSIVIFFWVQRRTLGTAWGDARHGLWAALVRTALLKLQRVEYHPMNWRPNLLVFGGDPNKRGHMLELSCSLVGERGMVSYFCMLKGEVCELAKDRSTLLADLDNRFAQRFPNALYRVDVVPDVYDGVVSIAQAYGFGSFESNTVMLGWPQKVERLDRFANMLRQLVSIDRSLLLLRLKPIRGFGARRSIDVWWGGMANNGGLMLLLAYLMKASEAWRHATVRIITVVNDDQNANEVKGNLESMLDRSRVDAQPLVLQRQGRPIAEIMDSVSGNQDLAILGLKLPAPEESAELFFERTNKFLEVLPTTILVCSARNFKGEPVLFDEESLAVEQDSQ